MICNQGYFILKKMVLGLLLWVSSHNTWKDRERKSNTSLKIKWQAIFCERPFGRMVMTDWRERET